MKLRALALGLTAVVALGGASAETTEIDTTAKAEAWTIAGVRVANPIDPSTWYDGAGDHMVGKKMIAINPADPDFWLGFVKPDTHSHVHATFTNPATLGQFLKPETYANMMNPSVWVKWMKPTTYAPLVDAQTMAYWVQPGAYTHIMDIRMYSQMIDPANYGALFNEAMAGVALDELTSLATDATKELASLGNGLVTSGKDLVTSTTE